MHWAITRIQIVVDRQTTNVTTVVNFITVPVRWNRIVSYIQAKWHLDAPLATKPSEIRANWKSIRDVTAVKNHTDANIVKRHLPIARVCSPTPLCTPDANDSSAKIVIYDFPVYRIYKRIEDRIKRHAVCCPSSRNQSIGHQNHFIRMRQLIQTSK